MMVYLYIKGIGFIVGLVSRYNRVPTSVIAIMQQPVGLELNWNQLVGVQDAIYCTMKIQMEQLRK